MTGAFCSMSFVRYFLSAYLLSIHVYGILCSGGFPVKVMQAVQGTAYKVGVIYSGISSLL